MSQISTPSDGAAFSLRDGIEELIRPSVTSSFVVAFCWRPFAGFPDLLLAGYAAVTGTGGRVITQAQQGDWGAA